MKKLILLSCIIFSSFIATAQFPFGGTDVPTYAWNVYLFHSGEGVAPAKKLITVQDSSHIRFGLGTIYFDSLAAKNDGQFTKFLGIDPTTGKIKVILKDSIFPRQTGNSGKLLTTNGSGLISWVSASGEANTASNVGSGAGLYKTKSGVDLQFKSLLGTANQITITGNTNDITLSLATRTMASATRSLVTTTSSTGYQISSTRDYSVNYSVFARVTSALIGTNTADVFLEIASTNSTSPADWTTVSQSGISLSGIVSTSGNTQTVGGFIPAGYYVRIRTLPTGGNAGSAVFTYQVGQENTY